MAVENDGQWDGLRRAMGEPDWAQDERFKDAEGRLANQDEIETKLGEWTQTLPPKVVMETLNGEGVPAGVVQRSSDLQLDPQLAHRGFFRNLEHQRWALFPIQATSSTSAATTVVLGPPHRYLDSTTTKCFAIFWA